MFIFCFRVVLEEVLDDGFDVKEGFLDVIEGVLGVGFDVFVLICLINL